MADAHLAYAALFAIGVPELEIVAGLEAYTGAWRRSEVVKTTAHGNLLLSDYGHHPTEISLTLAALKAKYLPRKLVVAFQPHQHSRTRELLTEFATCFDAADTLIIPNIYASRDSAEDTAYMTTERLVETLKPRYPNVINGQSLAHTLTLIQTLDSENPHSLAIVLLGAGSVDDLRYEM